jgi:hypothetical protein
VHFLRARCIHIKDSNNYDIWVDVKSINIGTDTGSFTKTQRRERKFGLYIVEQRIKLRPLCYLVEVMLGEGVCNRNM